MSGLLGPSPHSFCSYLLPTTTRFTSPRIFFSPPNYSSHRNPRFSRLFPPYAGNARRIRIDRSHSDDEEPSLYSPGFTVEWNESSDPDGNHRVKSDPLPNIITDEWGEKTELEPETPARLDPTMDDDEWGIERPTRADDKLGDLKRRLVDRFCGKELGFRVCAEVRGEIVELVSQLEARNPTPAPIDAPELLDGNWVLLYSAYSKLVPLLAIGATPILKIKKISQSIDTKIKTIVNAVTLTCPFGTFSLSASASFEVQSSSRLQVQYKEGAFAPPGLFSGVIPPEKMKFFGQDIDLNPVQHSMNPIRQAVSSISRVISGSTEPLLRVPIPGDRAKFWLLTTYLDHDLRISRAEGGFYVLAKEGSPFL